MPELQHFGIGVDNIDQEMEKIGIENLKIIVPITKGATGAACYWWQDGYPGRQPAIPGYENNYQGE